MPVSTPRIFCILFVFLIALQSESGATTLSKGIVQIAAVEGVTEYRLTNGLKVLLMPDSAKPTVTVNITYLVGSRFENYGETGMAHLLEHMMFKGTRRYPDIDVEFNQRGMRSNATTSLDRTNYYEQFEARDDNLRWAINMEADRMMHSNIAQADLNSEMTVVRNEFEMGENSPENVMLKRMQSIAFDWHNYGNATIGNRSDIENVSIKKLRTFYQMYYQPDNAVLLISGKIDVVQTLDWITSAFGRIPKPVRQLPVFQTREPTQDGERQFVVRRKGDTQLVMVGYKIPAAIHADAEALSVATDMLSDTSTGRLYKILVETGKAIEVFSTTIGSHDPGLVVIGAVVKNGDAIEPVRDELVAAIESFANTIPDSVELERNKRNYRNQTEKILTDPEVLSLELSEDIALGDWRYFFQNRDHLEQITANQISAAASRYFKRDNRVVGMFIPDDHTERAEIPASPSIEQVMRDFKSKLDAQYAEAFDPNPVNIENRTIRTSVGGLNIAILSKKNKGSTVSVVLNLHWGDKNSLLGKKMISILTDEMLLRGNRLYSREQLNDEIARLKITGNLYQFDTTRENLSAALTLVGQILKQPTFPENEFVLLKKQLIFNLESQHSDPTALAAQSMLQHFNHFPSDDWRASETSDESIARIHAIQLDDLRSFHQEFYGASHGELTIVGDVDMPDATDAINHLFGDWSSRSGYARIDDINVDIRAEEIDIDTPDKENGFYLARMNLNVTDSDPQYPALVLANYIFGGGAELNSRIMERLRQKLGLSYSGGSILHVNTLDNAAYFQISAIAAPQNLSHVASVVLEELKRIKKDGFTLDEVSRAKSGFLQQQVQSRAQDSQLAADLNNDQFLNRPFLWTQDFEDKIRALTVDQVNSAFKTLIKPDRMTVVIAGDRRKIARLAEK